MSNLAAVQHMYEAFGRHDVTAILAKLDDDVEWEYGIGPTNMPWYQERKGRDAVPAYFETVGSLDVALFHPKMFFENENIVLVMLDVQFTIKDTGKFVDQRDIIDIWHFNSKGKVEKFGHRLDTHSMWLASQKSN